MALWVLLVWVPSQPGLASLWPSESDLGASCGQGTLAIHTPPALVEGELEGAGMGAALFGELCGPVLGYEPLPQASGVTNVNRTQTREKMFSVSNWGAEVWGPGGRKRICPAGSTQPWGRGPLGQMWLQMRWPSCPTPCSGLLPTLSGSRETAFLLRPESRPFSWVGRGHERSLMDFFSASDGPTVTGQ